MKYDTQELKYQSQTILVTLSLKPLTQKNNSKKKKKLPTYPIFFEGRNLNATIFFSWPNISSIIHFSVRKIFNPFILHFLENCWNFTEISVKLGVT